MSIHFYTPGEESTSRPDSGREDWHATTTPIRPMIRPDGPSRRVGVGADANKLWAGGAASALIAGLVALTGVLVSRWLFHLSVLAPRQDGAYGDARTTALILVAVAAAIAATGLVYLLMLGTLRPLMFFGWIVALVTTIAVIFPFSTTAALDAKVATALVNLAIGVTIGALVGGVATRSIP
ncbi:MAG: DUF6069 family protein [Streptosporangiaceae bacterium]